MHKKIAIFYCLQSDLTEKGYQRFIESVAGMVPDAKVDGFAMEDIGFAITPGRIQVLSNGKPLDLSQYSLAYFKNRADKIEIVRCLSAIIHSAYPRIKTVDASTHQIVSSKLTEAVYMVLAGIRTPATIFLPAMQAAQLETAASPIFQTPFIVKDTRASKGKDNYLVQSWDEARRILEDNPLRRFIAQQYIPADGDYRFVMMGGEPAVVIHRMGTGGSHMNNTSQGGTGTLVADWQQRFSEDCLKDVRRAVTLFGRDTAGVDVILDRTTGHHYLLEVNSSPQLVSGAFVKEKADALQSYLQGLLGS